MSLYQVSRTDVVQPGEFEYALVVARGAALARGLVAHLPGVAEGGANVVAERVPTTHTDALLYAAMDDRQPLAEWERELLAEGAA